MQRYAIEHEDSLWEKFWCSIGCPYVAYGTATIRVWGQDYLARSECEEDREVLRLYLWWHHERPQRWDPYDELGVDSYPSLCDISQEQLLACERKTDIFAAEDQFMLRKLIELRECLWI